jgi:hypothetical protein
MGPLDKILALEAQYKNESFNTDGTYELIKGTEPFILSAPHSVTHYREGKPKYGEFMTGVLAKTLQQHFKCSCITKIENDLTDPNYDITHPYKDEIIELAKQKQMKFLLDLHIMSSERKPAIEIGTGMGRNVFGDDTYAKVLKDNFEKHGITPVIVDEHFTGGNPNTVSSTVSRNNRIPCVQIEINWRLLNLVNEQQQLFSVFESLKSSIETLRSIK